MRSQEGECVGSDGIERWYPLVKPDADDKIKDTS